MKSSAKEADRDYLRRGYWIKLYVNVDRNGYPPFKPISLNNDKLAPGGRSVRIFRVARGARRPELAEGEEWRARVVAYKLKHERTRDKREKIIFFLSDFERIKNEVKGLIDEKTGWIETRSGNRLLQTEIVDLKSKKEDYVDVDNNQVIIVKSYFSRDGELFHRSFSVYQVKKFAERLRQFKIDPQKYIKKLPKFSKEKFDLP